MSSNWTETERRHLLQALNRIADNLAKIANNCQPKSNSKPGSADMCTEPKHPEGTEVKSCANCIFGKYKLYCGPSEECAKCKDFTKFVSVSDYIASTFV